MSESSESENCLVVYVVCTADAGSVSNILDFADELELLLFCWRRDRRRFFSGTAPSATRLLFDALASGETGFCVSVRL